VVEPHPRLIRAIHDPWVAGAARSSPTAIHVAALRAEADAASGYFWKMVSGMERKRLFSGAINTVSFHGFLASEFRTLPNLTPAMESPRTTRKDTEEENWEEQGIHHLGQRSGGCIRFPFRAFRVFRVFRGLHSR